MAASLPPGDREPVVLVVDDDRALVGVMTLLLGEAGFEVITAYDGETALRRARDERPDLVILDLGLPRMGGDAVVRRIAEEAPTPILMVTGNRDQEEKARLLDLGADDYLTKPVGRSELLARVRAILRRANAPRGPRAARVALDGLELDLAAHSARVHDRELALTLLELRLLARLVVEPGAVATIAELLSAGWPGAPRPHAAWLRGPVHRVRAKLAEAGAAHEIENVRGVGYRLVPRDA